MSSNGVGHSAALRWRRSCGWLMIVFGLFVLLAADAKDAPDQPDAKPAVADADQGEPAPPDLADKASAPFGRLIRIPLPITGNVDTRIQQIVERVLAEIPKDSKTRPVLVFELAPVQNELGGQSAFGRALELAQFLSSRELSGVKTVAYIPKSIAGHAALVAMACEEIVMAPDATIGDAGLDEPAYEPINSTVRDGYSRIAGRRRTIPPEVALGMLDKDLEVLKVETDLSREFVLRSGLEELRKKRAVQSEDVVKRPGELARFSGREARELGFVKFLAANRAAVAKALGLPKEALDEDPSLDAEWRPVTIHIKGQMNPHLAARTQRAIEDQMRHQNANFICLQIDSAGGSLTDSLNLANFLAALDGSRVRTVAYIEGAARADATLIAMACDHLVMQDKSEIGGPGASDFDADEVQLAVRSIRDSLALKKQRSWSLPAAFIDPELKINKATQRETSQVAWFSPEELAGQPDKELWELGELLKPVGQPLALNAEKAEDVGLARAVVPNFDGIKRIYGIDKELPLVERNWADYLVEGLASPGMALLLLVVGFAALIAELQSPGIGVGAFVAGLCFLLFFWSKYLDGTAGWLEALLFASGVLCVLVEIFLLPGVGVFALGGGLLIIASLVLASQTFVLPHNEYQFTQLRDTLLSLAGVGVGVGVAAVLLRRFLPSTPGFNHMMLEPPSDEELEELAHRESIVEFDHLLGQQGRTVTQLTPSGKARFGNELVDVIADGQFVSRGEEVTVTEVHGNRIVVKSGSASGQV